MIILELFKSIEKKYDKYFWVCVDAYIYNVFIKIMSI